MNLRTLLTGALCAAAWLLAAGNAFENPGFEQWYPNGSPSHAGWRYSVSAKGKNGFAAYERSDREKHSGKYSLHLKDTVGGNYNHALLYQVSTGEIAPFRGKLLRLTVWIKQIAASRPKCVGVSISVGSGGKNVSDSAWIDTAGPADWKCVQLKVQVPKTADGAQICFCCASGWGCTAEAYFDDVTLSTEIDEATRTAALQDVVELKAQKKAAPVSAGKPDGDCYVQFLPLPPEFKYALYGGWRITKTPQKAGDPLVLTAPGGTVPYASFMPYTSAIDQTLDLSKVDPEKIQIECVLDKDLPVQLRLADMDPCAWFGHGQKLPDGNYLYLAQGKKIATKELLKAVRGVNLQFCTKLPPGTTVKVLKMCIKAPKGSPAWCRSTPPPEVAQAVKSYTCPQVVTEDGFSRPDIVNGTYMLNGNYHYFRGVWIHPHNHDWGPGTNKLNIQHIAYTTPPGKKVFDAVGFNSAQISGAHSMPGWIRYGLPIPVTFPRVEKELAAYFRNFEAEPLVMDFAFGFCWDMKKRDLANWQRLDQKYGEWHEFIPFCPENPDGDRYYKDYMIAGAVTALKNGGNIFAYELFNESSYNCQCRYNIRAFAKAMEKRFGTIAAANALWGTNFESFAEVGAITSLHSYPKLWPEWCDFISTRYAEMLVRYKEAIRSVDKRPNVYFTEQCGGAPPVHDGMDYRKIAEVCDILSMEGGVRFGTGNGDSANATSEGMEIMHTRNGQLNFSYAFYRALAKDKKPISNNESNSNRTELGTRVTSRRSDMITSLWHSLIHGASGIYFYVWEKCYWEWDSYEKAKQVATVTGTARAGTMLNPYNWDPKDLDAPKDFDKEFAPYSEKLMPMPRTERGNVALLFPTAAKQMAPFYRMGNMEHNLYKSFDAPSCRQFKVYVVFEDDIRKGLDKDTRAVILPYAYYFKSDLLPKLAEFAKRGGIIFAGKNAFAMDERGNKRTAKIPFPYIRYDETSEASCQVIPETLLKHKVFRRITAKSADGGSEFTGLDLQLVDRGDFKLIYCANFGDTATRLATFQLNLDDRDKEEYYLTDIVNRRTVLNGEKRTWRRADLAKGFPVLIPPHERVVLTLERKPQPDAREVTGSGLRELLKRANAAEAPYLEALRARSEQKQKEALAARTMPDVCAGKCRPVDLRKAANRGFSGEKPNAWFDQGQNDFRNIPLGDQVLGKVPFRIIDPAGNQGKGAVILGSVNRTMFPREVTVEVNAKAKKLYFLHAAAWAGISGSAATYIVRYADGSTADIPVRCGQEIADWWGASPLPNAKIAIESFNPVKDHISLYVMRWINPAPGKVISSITLRSSWEGPVVAVAGITREEE